MSVFELPTVTLIPNGIHHPPIEDGRLLPNSVKPAKNREYGKAELEITSAEAALFQNTPEKQTVWMSHGDLVTQAPTDFDVVAT